MKYFRTKIEEVRGVSDESEAFRTEFEEFYFKNILERDKMITPVLFDSSHPTDVCNTENSSSCAATPHVASNNASNS